MKLFRKREPTEKKNEAESKSVIKMVTTTGEFYYAWNGKLYESDIVRACIRPKVKAVGKLVGKHIRDDPSGGLKVNPDANIRFLLEEPKSIYDCTTDAGKNCNTALSKQQCIYSDRER